MSSQTADCALSVSSKTADSVVVKLISGLNLSLSSAVCVLLQSFRFVPTSRGSSPLVLGLGLLFSQEPNSGVAIRAANPLILSSDPTRQDSSFQQEPLEFIGVIKSPDNRK